MGEVVLTFWAIVLGSILGNIIYGFIKDRRHYKHRWKCPVCKYFSVEASSQDIIDRVKAVHIHEENLDDSS
jgi:hypothetical protein